MKLTRKNSTVVAIVALAVAAIVAASPIMRWRRMAYRRLWKDQAVERIAGLSQDTAWIQKQIHAMENKQGGLGRQAPEYYWMREDIIVMADKSWIVYRAVASKQDKRIDDIFIGRASNGKWYFTTFHFCRGMITLRQAFGQAPDLAAFIRAYSLEEFDGRSDKALTNNWDKSLPGYELEE
jgi:hypothetical protein